MNRKWIATALAAGALAAGSAAQAQDLGGVIAGILGLGSYDTPAVVAGQQQMYVDQYGRQFYYDQWGRQVFVQTTQPQIIGYDNWGRPIYGNNGQYAYGGSYPYGNYSYNRNWDADRDGVPNSRDRWPNDPRYR